MWMVFIILFEFSIYFYKIMESYPVIFCRLVNLLNYERKCFYDEESGFYLGLSNWSCVY